MEMFILGMAGYLHNGRYCGMFSSAVKGGSSSAQWQLTVGLLLMASDVFYSRAYGGGLQIQTTKGHPPNRGGDSVHICYAHSLIPHNAAGTYTGDPRGWH